jgi:hypothetical protein
VPANRRFLVRSQRVGVPGFNAELQGFED